MSQEVCGDLDWFCILSLSQSIHEYSNSLNSKFSLLAYADSYEVAGCIWKGM